MNSKREFFVAGITLVSVVLIVFQYLLQPEGITLDAIYIFDLAVVIILIIDFSLRTRESKEGIKFILKHAYELPAMIPLVVFGVLESETAFTIALRGLRLIRLFRLIQLASRISIVLGRTGWMIYTIVFSVMAVSLGAVGIYLIEYSVEGTKITNLGDAFWWAIVTVTTVGYGDVYPITAEGKVIAALLMIV